MRVEREVVKIVVREEDLSLLKQESTSTTIPEVEMASERDGLSEGLTESSSPEGLGLEVSAEKVLSKRARENRRRKAKKHFPVEDFNIRKCSDTFLETSWA